MGRYTPGMGHERRFPGTSVNGRPKRARECLLKVMSADRAVARRTSGTGPISAARMPMIGWLLLALIRRVSINGAELSSMSSSTLASVAAEQGGEITLVGRLVWVDRELGWATQWQVDWQGRSHRWQVRGVTFDEAFRRGIGGA